MTETPFTPPNPNPMAPEQEARTAAQVPEGELAQIDAAAIAEQPVPLRKRDGLGLWMRDLVISSAISILFITFLYQPVRVEGTSMLPRLENSDRLFINKFVYHIASIHRDDVVVFHYPRDLRESYIKRVIAVPGDHILINWLPACPRSRQR